MYRPQRGDSMAAMERPRRRVTPVLPQLLALALLALPPRCGSEALGSFLQEHDLYGLEPVLKAEGFHTREELVAAQLSADDAKQLGLGMKQRKKLLKALAVEQAQPGRTHPDPKEALSAATAAKQSGDLAGAYAILGQAIKASPAALGPYLAKAQMMCDADDYYGCKEHYAKGIELAPPVRRDRMTQDIALGLGEVAYRMGQARASSDYSSQRKTEGATATAVRRLQNPYETALSELRTALSLDSDTPSFVRALFAQGLVHEAVAQEEQGGWPASESVPLSITAWTEVLERLAASPKLASELR